VGRLSALQPCGQPTRNVPQPRSPAYPPAWVTGNRRRWRRLPRISGPCQGCRRAEGKLVPVDNRGGHCVEPFQPSGITTETGLSGQWLRRGSEGASVGRGPFTQRELVTVSGIRLDNAKRAGPPIAFLYRTLEPPNVRTVLVSYREASTGKVGRRNGAAPGEVSFSTNVLHYSPHRPHHGPEIPGFR